MRYTVTHLDRGGRAAGRRGRSRRRSGAPDYCGMSGHPWQVRIEDEAGHVWEASQAHGLGMLWTS